MSFAFSMQSTTYTLTHMQCYNNQYIKSSYIYNLPLSDMLEIDIKITTDI